MDEIDSNGTSQFQALHPENQDRDEESGEQETIHQFSIHLDGFSTTPFG